MNIFILCLIVFLVSVVAMMIGVLLKRRPLQPCSRYATGDAKVEGVSCDLCTHISRECDRKPEAVAEQEGESS